jgi:hypothetical protein
MKYSIFTLSLFTVLFSFAQPDEDFRKKMMESGEEAEKHDPIPETAGSPSDYDAFIRTRAWNARLSQSSIFTDVQEKDVGIIGGRVRGVLVDAENDIALVAPSGGGVWTFDPVNGKPFTPVDDFGSFMAVTDISQNPFNKSQIFLGTGDEQHSIPGKGVFVSNDKGQTFAPLGSTDPDVTSIYRYIRFVKFSPETEDLVYMVAGNSVLFRSTDGGTNWTEVFDTEYRDIRSVEFTAGNGIMLAVEDKGLYVSSTGESGTFSLVTSTVPNDATGSAGLFDGVVVATHAANRNIAYALFDEDETGSIFKTTDGGATWTKKTDAIFRVSQSWFCLTIGVHPTDPDKVIAGSIGWGYSTDGCANWVYAGGLEVDYHAVQWPTGGGDVAYIGYDQGLGRVDFSQTAQQWAWNGTEYVLEDQILQAELGKTGGFNTSQIYYGDYYPESFGDAFVFGQQDGGSFAQINGEERRVMVGDGGSIFINKQNPEVAYGSTQSGRLRQNREATSLWGSGYNSVDGFYQNHPNWITQFAGNYDR